MLAQTACETVADQIAESNGDFSDITFVSIVSYVDRSLTIPNAHYRGAPASMIIA